MLTFPRLGNAESIGNLQLIAVHDLIQRVLARDQTANKVFPMNSPKESDAAYKRLLDEVHVPAFMARLAEHGIHARTPDEGPMSPEETQMLRELATMLLAEFRIDEMKNLDLLGDAVRGLRATLASGTVIGD